MILVDGTILNSEAIGKILPSLEKRICKTLQKPILSPLVVIEACHKLAETIEQGAYSDILNQLIAEAHISDEQINNVIRLFKRESLLYKLQVELGEDYIDMDLTPPFYIENPIHRRLMPLGVLFHIAAGNVDGLPAYSVIEGLLTGNINILKLPAVDKGFTVQLLSELIRIEPILAEYIYVFDTSSNDITGMQAMAQCADGIVVWGGDTAIEAVRKLATPNTKIIEWGHKISFAYVTDKGMSDLALTGLAYHILNSKQLLCSSCQGIYIDTSEMSEVYDFSEKFIEILENVAIYYPEPNIGIEAQITLLLYNQELEAGPGDKKIYRGKRCSVIASKDQKLEVSFTYGNCWVKALPRKNIIEMLHQNKGYLQTVGLLCGSGEREMLSQVLCRAGATRITSGSEMSRMLCGENHDGEYPLKRSFKIVEY